MSFRPLSKFANNKDGNHNFLAPPPMGGTPMIQARKVF